jgi:hypothetical protein
MAGRLVTPTSDQPEGFLRLRKKLAAVVFLVGLVFLGTTGVQFIVRGDSRGETGFFLGIVLVGVSVHQWFRLRNARR